jgi:hypothetical protein
MISNGLSSSSMYAPFMSRYKDTCLHTFQTSATTKSAIRANAVEAEDREISERGQ